MKPLYKVVLAFAYLVTLLHASNITTSPSNAPSTVAPVTSSPVTSSPVASSPVTSSPVTFNPTTGTPTTGTPTTGVPTTSNPTTGTPTTGAPTTGTPTTSAPTTGTPTTGVPTTGVPTTGVPTTGVPTTGVPTTGVPTTGIPTTGVPNTGVPSASITSNPSSSVPAISTSTPTAAQTTPNFVVLRFVNGTYLSGIDSTYFRDLFETAIATSLGISTDIVSLMGLRAGSIIADVQLSDYVKPDGFNTTGWVNKLQAIIATDQNSFADTLAGDISVLQFSSDPPIISGGEYCDFVFIPYASSSNEFLLAASVFCCLGAFISFAAILFLIYFRDKPIILMSQRVFLGIMCCSLVVLNFSALPRIQGLQSPSSEYCALHIWLFHISFTLVLASLAVKEWRALRTFENQSFSGSKIDNKKMVLQIAGLMSVIVLVLAVWQGVAPPSPDTCSAYRCESSTTAFTWLAYVFESLLLVATLLIAWKSRKIPSIGAESVGIVITALFSGFVFLMIVLVVIAASSSSNDMEVFLSSFGIFTSTTVAACTIVFRKFFWFDKSIKELEDIMLDAKKPDFNNDIPQMASLFERSTSSHTIDLTFDPQQDIVITCLDTGEDMYTDGRLEKQVLVDPALKLSLLEKKATGFKIGEIDGWQEFVDRKTGDSFWVDDATGTVTHEDPSSDSTVPSDDMKVA